MIRSAVPLLAAAALALVAGVGTTPAAPGASPEELFARGNEQYAKGEYEGAAASYEAILEGGVRNSRVYYNLGNAYFKRNQIGQAILSYERALKLDPTDVDARENLGFANQRIRDRIPAEDDPYLLLFLLRLRDLLTFDQVTGLFLCVYVAGMALTGVWMLGRSRRWSPPVGIGALVLGALALTAGGWMLLQERARGVADQAIVLTEKLEVLSGPGTENTLLASVHEGTKVRIHNRRETWMQVTLPDGRAGWVKGERLGII